MQTQKEGRRVAFQSGFLSVFSASCQHYQTHFNSVSSPLYIWVQNIILSSRDTSLCCCCLCCFIPLPPPRHHLPHISKMLFTFLFLQTFSSSHFSFELFAIWSIWTIKLFEVSCPLESVYKSYVSLSLPKCRHYCHGFFCIGSFQTHNSS